MCQKTPLVGEEWILRRTTENYGTGSEETAWGTVELLDPAGVSLTCKGKRVDLLWADGWEPFLPLKTKPIAPPMVAWGTTTGSGGGTAGGVTTGVYGGGDRVMASGGLNPAPTRPTPKPGETWFFVKKQTNPDGALEARGGVLEASGTDWYVIRYGGDAEMLYTATWKPASKIVN